MNIRETKPGKITPKTSYSTPSGVVEITLADRLKQLIIFADTPDEVDAIAEAYRKIKK